jgi:hypothetical protein
MARRSFSNNGHSARGAFAGGDLQILDSNRRLVPLIALEEKSSEHRKQLVERGVSRRYFPLPFSLFPESGKTSGKKWGALVR